MGQVFAILFICLQLFGFFPLLRQSMRQASVRWSDSMAISTSVALLLALFQVSYFFALLFMAVIFFMTFISPLLFIYAY